MKCIVTENQLNYIESYEKVKKLFFKFWDKNGPLLNDSIFKMFGFNGTGSEISGVRLIRDDIFKFFREWYGVEGMNKAKELLSQNNHHVDCGGYDFNFNIKKFDFNRHGTVEINVVIDLNGATVDLIDPVENLAVKMMKEAADRTATLAGDGTTTAIVPSC